jgi:hypothetical protein
MREVKEEQDLQLVDSLPSTASPEYDLYWFRRAGSTVGEG